MNKIPRNSPCPCGSGKKYKKCCLHLDEGRTLNRKKTVSTKELSGNKSMVWTIKIECVWGRYLEEECIRVIEVFSDISLYDLHIYIQKIMDFDNDHLFEFIAGRHHRNRKIVFAEEAWDYGYEKAMEEYYELKLEDIYPLPKGMQLFYHFDFGDDWYFKIVRTRKKIKEPEMGIEYPQIIESIGPAPVQYVGWDE